MIGPKWQLIEIIDHDSVPREDISYPLERGGVYTFEPYPSVGNPVALCYELDNKGNPREGFMVTSTVVDFIDIKSKTDEKRFIMFETHDDLYCFEAVEGT